MSTYTSEPGTRLAGRYRLVDQIAAGAGWTYWKATDETLARPVTVLTFAPGFPRITETVTAARAASRLNDTRFGQVFDVEDTGEAAYVVLEWVAGESLLDMLADGPLDPFRAVSLIAEAAQALAAAHRAGLAHLRLAPRTLHWTAGGGVKISGLGVDAALAGEALTATEDPALTDTGELGRLLYAALTAHWPGPGSAELPPAPLDSGGEPCTPRQVAAGVPASIDSLTCRALFQQHDRHGPALTTPAAFADALSSVVPAAVIPPVPPPMAPNAGDGYQRSGRATEFGPTNPFPRSDTGTRSSRGGPPADGYRRRHPATERSAVARSVVSLVIVLVLAAIAVTAWAISRSLHHSTPGAPAHSSSGGSSGSAAAAAAVLKPVSALVFNPDDTSSNSSNSDDPGEAQFALGGTADRFWHTSYYFDDPKFGGLKKGLGLIVDMGTSVRLSQLTVKFGNSCCAEATIEIGNNPSSKSSFTPVTSPTSVHGVYTFPVSSTAGGRYVLIWFTSLPPLSDNKYQAQIYNVSARGTTG
jgi:hypothetical protein